MLKKRLRVLLMAAVAAGALSAALASSASAGTWYTFCNSYQTGSYTCWDATARNVQQINVYSTNTADYICAKLYNSYYGWLQGGSGPDGGQCASGGPIYTFWNGWLGQAVATLRPDGGAGTRRFEASVYY